MPYFQEISLYVPLRDTWSILDIQIIRKMIHYYTTIIIKLQLIGIYFIKCITEYFSSYYNFYKKKKQHF